MYSLRLFDVSDSYDVRGEVEKIESEDVKLVRVDADRLWRGDGDCSTGRHRRIW